MKLFALFLFLISSAAQAGSWRYNQDGGFGLYEPLGWQTNLEGRSTTLTGPQRDTDQSQIFIGSDWWPKATSLAELKAMLQLQFPDVRPGKLSGIDGFAVGDQTKGGFYALRFPKNIIVLEFDLRGSADQMDEGQLALSSIEISTDAIEYP